MAGTFGSGIKSVQRGTKTTAAAVSDTQAITAVVLAKSWLNITARWAASQYKMKGYISGTELITFTQRGAVAATVEWEVIEYY